MAANKGTKQLGFDTKRKPLTKKQYDALSLKERLRMYDAAEKKEGSATGQRSSAGSLPTDVEERLTNKPYRYTERGRLGIGRTENVSESDIRKGQARAAEIKRTAKSGAPLTPKMANGGSTSKVQTSADTARKLATEMGGMKKGGKPKSGLAVMIAIGAPMKGEKKPVKKMGGGMMYANGGKPDKFAQGGAGKVRKGMMTPEGKIIHAMNKVRGK